MNLPPLPKPSGFRTRYRSEPGMIGHYPWTYADQSRRRTPRPEHEDEDLFTAEQVRQAQRDAVAADRAQIVITKNEVGQICMVSRQDEEGRILSILAESNQAVAAAVPEGYAGSCYVSGGEHVVAVEFDTAEHAEAFQEFLAAAPGGER